MSKVSINSLAMFMSVATLSSFSKAAEANEVTQSAVSQSVSTLEENFGNRLIERSQGRNQKVTLTKAGRELKGRAKLILEHFEKAKNAVAKIKNDAPAAKKEKAAAA